MTIPIFNDVDVAQSPWTVIEGGEWSIAIPYPDTVTVDGSSFMYAFRGTKDDSSTVLSGSLSASGNVLTLKTITSVKGGSQYRLVWAATCQGQREPYGCTMIVRRKSGR